MPKKRMLINAAELTENRIAVISDGKLVEYYTERHNGGFSAGNVYKGIVVGVERSLQAAFVDIGGPANGFLQAGDVSFEAAGKNRKKMRNGPPLIQDLLRRGQEIVVQITKEAIGTKGPALTTFVSLPGRYLVLMPSSTHIGVSKKIEDEEVRKRLKKMLKELDPPQGIGYIIRTAGADRTKTELKKDLSYLTRLWKAIKRKSESARARALVYEESDLAIRTMRDIFTPDVDEIVTDSREIHRSLVDFFKAVMPRHANRVMLHDSASPLFDHYDVEPMVAEIFKREIALPQGGSVIIEETEALVAIDVNSGRFRTGSAEQTAFKIDMKAAEEITRQIRLRDLGGLIVIDFIDMREQKHVRALEKRMRELMRDDRARYAMTRMSQFGIIEMTRQRLRPSLQGRSSGICPQCGGTGKIQNLETVSLHALRRIKAEMLRSSGSAINVMLHPRVAEDFQNNMRAQLVHLENDYNRKIVIRSEPFAEISEVRVEHTS